MLGKTIAKKLSSSEPKDIVCDALDQDEKQQICDEMRKHLFNYNYSGVFELFAERASSRAVPLIVDPSNPYTCTEIPIENLSMEKRMFWCESRRYDEIESTDYVEMPGFFCAGSHRVAGRVYAFRPPQKHSRNVTPVGEMDNVQLILTRDRSSLDERQAVNFSDDDYVSLDTDLLLP